ncbi:MULTISPECIES: methyltransferase [Actinomadura]|uniref:Methyltransferase n=1 Tax=Actinomadura litoris TaxID=2678616 RepID=A0A7K1L287_9ACTN|nr:MULTISPECIES: methyltransferase [Actinomadura]MBT2208913.1 methyltransferase [Actinomadura sp. NEAU-AAG7]MUN38522.1 methyltransferase [Actinomadura litoris]
MSEKTVSTTSEETEALRRAMWDFHSGLRMGFMLSAIAEIGVADHLADGPLSADELAARTGSHADSLYRVLRAMASKGVFTEVSRRTFGLTPLADILRSDSPGSMRDVFRLQGKDFMRNSYAEIGYCIRTGKPAFDYVNGEEMFAYLAKHPEMNKLFSGAMGNAAGDTQQAAIAAYDLTGVRKLVDIGGAHGHLMSAILSKYPEMRGVVFDQPHVVPGAEKVLTEAGVFDRAELVGGSYLREVPAGGDVYTISHVLHQLSDNDAITILTNIRKVMAPGARVLIIDPLIPEGDAPHPGKFMDITMMALSEGRDRTEFEFVEVFEKAGLRLSETVGLASPSSVVVAVAA